MTLKWTVSDAITIAFDMLNNHEIGYDQLEEKVNQLWAEMQIDNEEESA